MDNKRRPSWLCLPVSTYRAALLAPVQFLSHDLHNARKRLVCRLHVKKAQPRPAGNDIDGSAGIFLDGIQHLNGEVGRGNEKALG